MTKVRETARQSVIESVAEVATKAHHRNYWKLHVRRSGLVSWSEFINQSDDLIDGQAEHFQAIPNVACVGTGSYACNCDYCEDVYYAEDEARAKEQGRKYAREDKYEDDAEAIASAVGDSDLTTLEEEMVAAFDAIPAGYFDDEKGE